MAKRITEYPIITISKDELHKLMAKGWKNFFYELKQLSATRGLIYTFPKRATTLDIRFRVWRDKEGNLCQQNYAVDITSKDTYVTGSGPFVVKRGK